MAETPFRKRIRHLVEGVGALIGYGLFGLLPVRAASAVGGFLAHTIGPRVGVSDRARRNLRRAMPDLSEPEIERIVRGMWDNLGRVIAEYPHLGKFKVFVPDGYVEARGVIQRLKDNPPAAGERYIFFTAHYGNWEIAPLAVHQAGVKSTVIYRAANNPIVDRLLLHIRRNSGTELIAKGAAGRRAVAAMHKGFQLCLLVDQKMNTGVAAPFFGRPAMTENVSARMALRYNCHIVPVRVERLKGVKFRLTFEEPMELHRTGDDAVDALALTTRINARVEAWIRERPEHWFWLHRRWMD